MGQGAALKEGLTRRALIGGAALLAGCRDAPRPFDGVWVGSSAAAGHRLRDRRDWPSPSVRRRADVLVIGGGVAGLAALRAAVRAGHHDAQLLEIEPAVGGNSRAHALAGMACPQGAHYLPLPTADAREVSEWLHQIGLLRQQLGRTQPDERHLCHSPQERLFIDGGWVEGLLPPAEGRPATLAQYRSFAAAIGRQRGFALPSHRAPAGQRDAHAALDAIPFAAWLDAQGLADERLRWYLDHCCRDDYGAGADEVSAWAGVHYFASRHGFRAPGDAEREAEAVFTWPEGNAWLVERLAQPLQDRLHAGRSVWRVSPGRHDVQVLAWDDDAQRSESWSAQTVVLSVPLFVAARIVDAPPAALQEAAVAMAYAPWLVANLQLDAPLLDRHGAPPSWDNVIYRSAGLGYVDAMHQSLRAHAGPTVLTAYHALPRSERAALLQRPWQDWAEQVLAPLDPVHPDLRRRLRVVALSPWGHAMAIPLPGLHSRPALAALRALRGRLRFAHSDLAGYSVFEEAFTAGSEVFG